MGLTRRVLLLLPAIMVLVTGQGGPTAYPYDCRRTSVTCANNATCNFDDGVCACPDGFEGDDCKLDKSREKTTCPDETCENNAICYDNNGTDACYCDSNTYGTKCENPRVTVWCTGSEMFINVYPHGDANFTGNLFISTLNNDGRNRSECILKNVADDSPPDLAANYAYVKTVQDETPALKGYYIGIPHAAADGVEACRDAEMENGNDSTKYTQRVVVEYNNKIISGVDQVISFTCDVLKTAGNLESNNTMSVKILGSDDYDKLNATDTIEPVTFTIETPEGTTVTNTVGLGDPLNLVFELQSNDGAAYDSFKVTQCTATNSATGDNSADIEFLTNDCPAPGSELLYRGNIAQTSNEEVKKTTIPLSAFRFVGSIDQVAFTCTLKLCTVLDSAECTKTKCSGEPEVDNTANNTDTGSANDTDTGSLNGTDTGTLNGTDTGTTNATADGTNDTTNGTDTVTSPPGVRRKRAANNDDKEQEVTRSISVSSGYPKNEEEEEDPPSVQDQDCMQHTQVVTVIIIFSVVLLLMLLLIIALVVCLLRSRSKVVDAPDMTSNTMSRYSLPRLSVATSI
ncbi:EGF-like domain-containing protein 2 [Littorina saxatilis]|uniref:EGF-like domain-containing protein 2 n=1 Tax=Littorina saxatilis TaxID=31220 RepID=UPI0038B5C25E